MREEFSWPSRDDEEPTDPYPRDPRRSGTIPSSGSTARNLPQPDATQLAEIVAAWEDADPATRLRLAEFAKRLTRSGEK